MKRARILLVAILTLLLVATGAGWWILRPNKQIPFGIGNEIAFEVQPAVSCGMSFATMVAPDGSLWGWGKPAAYLVRVPAGEVPQLMSSDRDWKKVSAGFHGLVALKQDGSVWGLGSNGEGLLGVSTNQVKTLSRLIPGNDWADVRAGVAHCMALKKNGELWVWGRNGYGEMGIGKTTPFEPPMQVGQEKDWVAISPGDFHCYALKKDGSIWGWGSDFQANRTILTPQMISPDKDWSAISAGDYHLAGLKRDGSIWIIGANASLISGKGSNPGTNWTQVGSQTNWIRIESGRNNLLAKKKDGRWWAIGAHELKGWGSNRDVDGFVKVPMDRDPLAMGSQRGTTLLLMPDGRLWSVGARVGSRGPQKIGERLQELLNRAINFFTRRTTTFQTASETHDQRPVLIWEANKE